MTYLKLKPTHLLIISLTISGLFVSCNQTTKNNSVETVEEKKETIEKLPYNTNNTKGMLLAIGEACGGIDALKALKDVEYDYQYISPDGKKDISKERYIFSNETSWAKYTTHQVNVPSSLEGDVVQFFDGKNSNVYANQKPLNDPQVIGTGQFLRQANYFWFTMMFKLSDPGIISEYKGQEDINGAKYDVLHVTYNPEITGKEQNDIFILYINPESRMVESFKFSLPAFGVNEPVLLAELTYEEIDGIQVITRRVMSAPKPDGSGMALLVNQQSKNVKFNNGFTTSQLSKNY